MTKNLPNNWQIRKLGEIGTIFNGDSINEQVKKDKYLNVTKGLPYVATKDIDRDSHRIDYDNGVRIPFNETSFKIAHKNAVLICSEGGNAGRKMAYLEKDVCFVNKLLAIETKESIDSRFVFYWYLAPSFSKAFKSQIFGLIGGISRNNFKNLTIPIPPLPEQKRIVKILDEVFEGVAKAKANTEKNLQNARELFENYLQTVFTHRGETWKERKFGDLVSFRNGINFTKSSRGGSVKIIGVKDFQNNYWAPLENLDTVITDGVLPDSDMLQENDILFVRSNGNMALIGRCLLVGTITDRITHSGFTIRTRLNDNNVIPKYLCHFLKSNKARQEMIDNGIGTNIKSLNQVTLSKLVIPVPPIADQVNIVKKIESLDIETKKLEVIYQQKLDDLEELKKSVLQKAFNGEL